MGTSLFFHAKYTLRRSRAVPLEETKRVTVVMRNVCGEGWENWRCVARDRSLVVSSAEVGVAVVVGMGGEEDDMDARRARRGSGEGPSVEDAMI